MWEEALGWLKFISSLVGTAKRDRAERERVRRRIDELTDAVQFLLESERQRHHEEALRHEADERRRADEANEREKLLLRLKIQLLEFERRLPPPLPGAPLTPPLRLEPD